VPLNQDQRGRVWRDTPASGKFVEGKRAKKNNKKTRQTAQGPGWEGGSEKGNTGAGQTDSKGYLEKKRRGTDYFPNT